MSEEKKTPPRAQIFRYFRIESRNNNQRFSDMRKQTCSAAKIDKLQLDVQINCSDKLQLETIPCKLLMYFHS